MTASRRSTSIYVDYSYWHLSENGVLSRVWCLYYGSKGNEQIQKNRQQVKLKKRLLTILFKFDCDALPGCPLVALLDPTCGSFGLC